MNQINDYRKKNEEPVPVCNDTRFRDFQNEKDPEK